LRFEVLREKIKGKFGEGDDYPSFLSLVSSMLLVAGPTIYWTALCRLERHFSFSAAVRTCDFVHSSAAVSFLTHTYTTLQVSYAQDNTLRSSIRSVPSRRVGVIIIKAIPQAPANAELSEIASFLLKPAVFCLNRFGKWGISGENREGYISHQRLGRLM